MANNNSENENQDTVIPEIIIDGDELNDVKQISVSIDKPKNIGKQRKKNSHGGPREKTPPEILGAIIGAYLSGKFASQSDIARELGISEDMVGKTISKIPKDYVPVRDANINQRVASKTLEFLESGLEALANISRITENHEWLMSQPADKIAVFYGVTADKVMKIMELIERANESED